MKQTPLLLQSILGFDTYHIQSTISNVADALVSDCNLRALDYFSLVYYCNEMTKPKQITQESSLKSETVICTALGMLSGSFFTLSIPVLQLCKDFPCAILPQMKNNCLFFFAYLFVKIDVFEIGKAAHCTLNN